MTLVLQLAVYPQRPVLAAGRQRRIKVCRKPQLVRGRHRPVCADHQTATFHSIPERFANLGSLLIKPTHLNTWNLGFTKDNNHFPCATPQVSLDSPSTVEKPRACFLWSRALSLSLSIIIFPGEKTSRRESIG